MPAFLFDLDGTLVDSERENAESIARVLAARGRPLTAPERAFVVGHGWREIYAMLVAAGGVDLSFDALKSLAADEKERLLDEAGLTVLPGAAEFVRKASAHGPVAVVSGSSRREIADTLRRLRLADVIPWFVGAEDVSAGKPSPEGYLKAAKHLGVPPGECTVFEDSAAGCRAARDAGMFCVALAVGNFAQQDQSAAHLHVEDFRALGDEFFVERRRAVGAGA